MEEKSWNIALSYFGRVVAFGWLAGLVVSMSVIYSLEPTFSYLSVDLINYEYLLIAFYILIWGVAMWFSVMYIAKGINSKYVIKSKNTIIFFALFYSLILPIAILIILGAPISAPLDSHEYQLESLIRIAAFKASFAMFFVFFFASIVYLKSTESKKIL